MANNWRTLAILTTSGLLTVGCLIKDESHTLYLDPETAAVTWAVLEQDVRSDGKTAADRAVEELAYWNSVQDGDHEAAETLRLLGAADIKIQVLRSRTPFSVLTSAVLPAIDEVGRRLLVVMEEEGTSVLVRTDDATEWTWTMVDDEFDIDMPLRVVLLEGRFESGVGFTFDSDRRVATFAKPDQGSDKFSVLKLRWTTASQPRQVP